MLRDFVLSVAGVIWGVVLFLIGARFIALLIDANRDSEIIRRLYDYSEWLVSPFFGVLGLVNKGVEDTGGVFEPASLVAFAIYFVLGVIFFGLLREVFYGDYRFSSPFRHHHGHA